LLRPIQWGRLLFDAKCCKSSKMQRKIENPNIIALSELPEAGKSFNYDEKSGELTPTLSDVIQDNPFKVDLFVYKMGNSYQASGQIETSLNLNCARCGADLQYPIREKINEILIVTPELPRLGKSARVNNTSELSPDLPDCITLRRPELNVGEFVREIIVLNEPFQPLCAEPCVNPYLDQLAPAQVPEKKESPFAILKGLKLNS
jgi:uncharacterized protein